MVLVLILVIIGGVIIVALYVASLTQGIKIRIEVLPLILVMGGIHVLTSVTGRIWAD